MTKNLDLAYVMWLIISEEVGKLLKATKLIGDRIPEPGSAALLTKSRFLVEMGFNSAEAGTLDNKKRLLILYTFGNSWFKQFLECPKKSLATSFVLDYSVKLSASFSTVNLQAYLKEHIAN